MTPPPLPPPPPSPPSTPLPLGNPLCQSQVRSVELPTAPVAHHATLSHREELICVPHFLTYLTKTYSIDTRYLLHRVMLLPTASTQHQPLLTKLQLDVSDLRVFRKMREVSAVQASCTTELYQLEADALPVQQRMPLRDYTSYLTVWRACQPQEAYAMQ